MDPCRPLSNTHIAKPPLIEKHELVRQLPFPSCPAFNPYPPPQHTQTSSTSVRSIRAAVRQCLTERGERRERNHPLFRTSLHTLPDLLSHPFGEGPKTDVQPLSKQNTHFLVCSTKPNNQWTSIDSSAVLSLCSSFWPPHQPSRSNPPCTLPPPS